MVSFYQYWRRFINNVVTLSLVVSFYQWRDFVSIFVVFPVPWWYRCTNNNVVVLSITVLFYGKWRGFVGGFSVFPIHGTVLSIVVLSCFPYSNVSVLLMFNAPQARKICIVQCTYFDRAEGAGKIWRFFVAGGVKIWKNDDEK